MVEYTIGVAGSVSFDRSGDLSMGGYAHRAVNSMRSVPGSDFFLPHLVKLTLGMTYFL